MGRLECGDLDIEEVSQVILDDIVKDSPFRLSLALHSTCTPSLLGATSAAGSAAEGASRSNFARVGFRKGTGPSTSFGAAFVFSMTD